MKWLERNKYLLAFVFATIAALGSSLWIVHEDALVQQRTAALIKQGAESIANVVAKRAHAIGGLTDYAESQVVKHYFRTGTIDTKPTTIAIALIRATRGTWTAATAYAVNDTVIPSTPNGRIYRATAVSGTGTSAGTEPTWPTTAAGTVVDNAGANQITWTEQQVALEACTFTEVANTGGYARPTLNPLDANWAAPSAGSGAGTGQTSNSSAISYSPSANWAGTVWGFMVLDNSTYGSGNCIAYASLTTPKVVNSGDTVSFAIGALTVQIDQ